MKNTIQLILIISLVVFGFQPNHLQATVLLQQQQEFTEYRGSVVNNNNGRGIANAQLAVDGTNISTITNSDGEFSLKVPNNLGPATVSVSNLGYQTRTISLEYFQAEGTEIRLDELVEELGEVSIFSAQNPKKLVQEMLRKKGDNYVNDPALMTAFYRESISRGRRNVSLSEAVVKIHKQAYTTGSREQIELVRARKTADYDRLDTLALKLRGGPYNALYVDVMKYPDFLFYEQDLENYRFNFGEPTRINDRYVYVVDFEDTNKNYPWYYGQLYIDAENQALIKAVLNLNVDNRSVASGMFVSKKPGGTRVYPIEVSYEVDYYNRNDKWYFGYARASLLFVVNWKRKLFNSRYLVNSEMAVTNWQPATSTISRNDPNVLDPRVVMSDDITGFSDPEFWGDNNIIEPDKSIQNAIEKIRQNLD
ncbi:carboxypeptidase-like regulatory domain-containing protein [Salegentibacter sp. HM20]